MGRYVMTYKSLTYPERWILKGIPALFILGTLMHFVYDILWESPLAGLVSAVNESIWEHAKLVLWPVILWWSLYYCFRRQQYKIDRNKWFGSALVALLTALAVIPLLYYFYTSAFGVELLWVDILILFLADLFGQLLGLHVYRHGKGIPALLVIFIFIVLVILFAVFTFYPPQIPWFRDGVSGKYGILYVMRW